MKVNKQLNNIGVIRNWNKSLNGKVCIIISERNISYNTKYDICKVLVDNKIYTVPKYFIKTCTNINVEL